VRLALPPHTRIHNVFHVSLLSPHEESKSFTGRPTPAAPYFSVPEHAEETWHLIDRLVDRRGQGAKLTFRVRWQGYGPTEDTWESATTCAVSWAGRRSVSW
jgi:hypothetical protein